MKLIDILVRELPKRGGWPAGAAFVCQYQKDGGINVGSGDGNWDHTRTRLSLICDFPRLFGDNGLGDNVDRVSREQYESALASYASQIAPMGTVGDAVAEAVSGLEREVAKENPYLREIKPGVWVDVYDVLNAWAVTNPALQHLLKKALQPGERGHKSREQDLQDIIDSAIRAKELEIEMNNYLAPKDTKEIFLHAERVDGALSIVDQDGRRVRGVCNFSVCVDSQEITTISATIECASRDADGNIQLNARG